MQVTDEVVRLLVEHVRHHPDVALVLVYGSHARGTATEASDLDILFVTDSVDPHGLAVSFVLYGRTIDYWPVRWPFLDTIADGHGGRPWVMAASLVLDAQVAYARSEGDTARFEAIRQRISDFVVSADRDTAAGVADTAFADVTEAVGAMHIALARGDELAARIGAWRVVHASINCVALLAHRPFRGRTSPQVVAIEDLGLLYAGSIERIRQMGRLLEGAEMVAIADECAGAVADAIAEARRERAHDPDPSVLDGTYAEIHEHLVKIEAAAADGDGLLARSEAHAVTGELAGLLLAAATGAWPGCTDRVDASIAGASLPDADGLLTAEDLTELGTEARDLDARLRAWLTAQDARTHILGTVDQLDALLRNSRRSLASTS
jgi:hypothetical protein